MPRLFVHLSSKLSSVQFSSVTRLCPTPWTAALQALLSITNSQSLLKLMSIELVMPSNHFILCHPLLFLPSIFPSIRVFSNESVLHMRWPKYWSFTFSISPSNEHPVLISSRMDWLDPLAVQGTLKSLLQHHSSKASILWHSAFFIGQPSHPYMTTGKTIALTRLTFVDKVMSLLFNMLSRLVINFLPRSKCLLITWLQSPSAVILEPQNIKSLTGSTASPFLPFRDGTGCHDLQVSSVQFSHSVVSNSLQPHESQHARTPCPSPTPRVHSDSRPSSQRCHPVISSSVVPFSSCPQSLPASESFPMSQLFA